MVKGWKVKGYMPMQEVTPKVVAMAVSTVMMMWSILLQVFLFSIYDLWFMISFFCTTEDTESHGAIKELWVVSYELWVVSCELWVFSFCYSLLFVIQTTVGRKDLGDTKQWKQVDVLEIFRTSPQQFVFTTLRSVIRYAHRKSLLIFW